MKLKKLKNVDVVQAGLAAGAGGAALFASLPPSLQVIAGIISFGLAWLAQSPIDDDKPSTEGAQDRLDKPHSTGIGAGIIFGIALLSFAVISGVSNSGCGHVPPPEIHAPAYSGEGEARLIVPVTFGDRGFYIDAICVPETGSGELESKVTCGVCVESGELSKCACFENAERIECPAEVESE